MANLTIALTECYTRKVVAGPWGALGFKYARIEAARVFLGK
jgi:hypothetical protein